MFSKACEYGIRATIHIAQQSHQNRRINLKEISKAIDSPVAFTAKILQSLAKNEIIQSVKGPSGGYEISSEKIKEISLSSIVVAIDGDQIYYRCGLGLKKCSEEKPCPVHHKFKRVRDELESMLRTTTIQNLAEGLENGMTFLKQ